LSSPSSTVVWKSLASGGLPRTTGVDHVLLTTHHSVNNNFIINTKDQTRIEDVNVVIDYVFVCAATNDIELVANGIYCVVAARSWWIRSHDARPFQQPYQYKIVSDSKRTKSS
jgi:hypothetical protein